MSSPVDKIGKAGAFITALTALVKPATLLYQAIAEQVAKGRARRQARRAARRAKP
jgi:hypothetical protein